MFVFDVDKVESCVLKQFDQQRTRKSLKQGANQHLSPVESGLEMSTGTSLRAPRIPDSSAGRRSLRNCHSNDVVGVGAERKGLHSSHPLLVKRVQRINPEHHFPWLLCGSVMPLA